MTSKTESSARHDIMKTDLQRCKRWLCIKETGFKYKRAAIEESCAVWEMCKKVQLAKKKANQLNIKHYQGGTVYEKKNK